MDVEYSPSANTEGDGGGDGGDDVALDTRQQVRESSVEFIDGAEPAPPDPVIIGGCDGGVGEEAGCDPMAGQGCCLGTGTATCIEQSTVGDLCKAPGQFFVTCLRSTPDTACCYRTNANGVRFTAQVADCDGGPIACQTSDDCPSGQGCQTTPCANGAFLVGQCGDSPPPSCP